MPNVNDDDEETLLFADESGWMDEDPEVPEPDYCGCCGGLASEPPKGEHGRCCATLHDTGLSRAGLAQNAQGHEVELDWYKQLPPPSITDAQSTLIAHRVESELCCTVYDAQCICLPGCRCNCRSSADRRPVCSCPKPAGSC